MEKFDLKTIDGSQGSVSGTNFKQVYNFGKLSNADINTARESFRENFKSLAKKEFYCNDICSVCPNAAAYYIKPTLQIEIQSRKSKNRILGHC